MILQYNRGQTRFVGMFLMQRAEDSSAITDLMEWKRRFSPPLLDNVPFAEIGGHAYPIQRRVHQDET